MYSKFVQFFSASTHHWEILTKHCNKSQPSNPPVKSLLSRYISKYRVFEIRVVAGLFVTRLVADDVWRFYNGSQPIRDINFDSCRVPRLGALGACDLWSYKQYFDGRIFRPENYRGHLLRKLCEKIADALRIHCKTKVRFSEYFEYLSMEWKSEKSTIWTMIRELIR